MSDDGEFSQAELHNLKAPWPWFGGKSDAAPHVWAALGDVEHYVEPFAGSLAVMLLRPHPVNRTYYSETANDIDGLLVNAWRSIQWSPRETADAASWPVSEADMHARHLALLKWREENSLERLMADPKWHDPEMGGWWMWGQSCWIGSGWCSGRGPWIIGDDGRITKRESADDPGVLRQIPDVANDGRGVLRPQMREPGVNRKTPNISDDGRGVARPQMRERTRPHVSNNGTGVHHASLRADGMGADEFHPMTMPELLRRMRLLSARLRHVRILNGDWRRATTSGVLRSLSVRNGGRVGVFYDPPYSSEAGRETVYTEDDMAVAHAVREAAREQGKSEDTRIVLAGFDTEHESLEADGWTCVEWFRRGYLKGGMRNQGKKGTQQHRERLWLSPHCLRPDGKTQLGLF